MTKLKEVALWQTGVLINFSLIPVRSWPGIVIHLLNNSCCWDLIDVTMAVIDAKSIIDSRLETADSL